MGCSLCTIQQPDEHYKLLQGACQVIYNSEAALCRSWLVTVPFWFVYSSLTYKLDDWLNLNWLRNVIHFYCINYNLIEWTSFKCLWEYAVCLWRLFCMLKRLFCWKKECVLETMYIWQGHERVTLYWRRARNVWGPVKILKDCMFMWFGLL